MKKVEAIIRQERVSEVLRALADIGYGHVTSVDVRSHGEELGYARQWRGTTYVVDVMPKTKIEVLVPDNLVQRVVSVIREHAAAYGASEGTLVVIPLEDVIDLHTGEHACGPLKALV